MNRLPSWHVVMMCIVVSTLASSPSRASSRSEWNTCSDDNAAATVRIAACTSLLDQGGGTDAMRALVFSNRGNARTDSGDIEMAVADFDAAIKLKPDLAEAFNGRCWAFAVQGRKLDDALRDCNEALRLEPGNADTLDSRAFVYLRQRQYAKAIADYSVALAGKPDEASSLYGRGLARAKLGLSTDAATDIAQAKAKDPKIADTFAAMGLTP
jgi:tetratricopeptide (TPR) repeat protein